MTYFLIKKLEIFFCWATTTFFFPVAGTGNGSVSSFRFSGFVLLKYVESFCWLPENSGKYLVHNKVIYQGVFTTVRGVAWSMVHEKALDNICNKKNSLFQPRSIKEVTKKVAHAKKSQKFKTNLSNCSIQVKNCNFEPFCFLTNCVLLLLRREHMYLRTEVRGDFNIHGTNFF